MRIPFRYNRAPIHGETPQHSLIARGYNVFDTLDMAPPDAIMGLTEAFKKDPNPNKINLTIGVYKDTDGNTPIFSAVKKAEARVLADETTKSYLSIEGSEGYAKNVQTLLFGTGHEIITQRRAVTAHTPGGTGGLRVAADLIHSLNPAATVWLSEPTWPNHPGIFQAAGIATKTYPYYDDDAKSLRFDAMLAALEAAAEGDFVLLHGCCHNPTGLDPTLEQWERVAELVKGRKLIPFLDFAYQGLGDGLEEDPAGLRTVCAQVPEAIVTSSFSKNFGLYRERTGAVTILASSEKAADAVRSHLKRTIRCNYSNPPAHGALIVTAILDDPALRAEWERELRGMCARIRDMRELFVRTLKEKGVERDFSFLTRQKGMFSYSGLSPEHVDRLREEFSVYIVRSGRINVASITPSNMDALCNAIAAVLR